MVPWELCTAQVSLGIQQQEEWPSRSLVMGFLRKYHHSGLRTLQISTLPFMSNVVFHCHFPSPLKQFSGQKHNGHLSTKHAFLRVNNDSIIFSVHLYCPDIIPDSRGPARLLVLWEPHAAGGARSGILSCPPWYLSLAWAQQLT